MTGTVFTRLTALADPIRCRLLLVLDHQELTVSELKQVLQLPQSTISRHLKVLSDEGWITSRTTGTSNWYRFAGRGLDSDARALWHAVRDQVAGSAAARRDHERVATVVAGRHSRSQQFFATSAGQWDLMRAELFGVGVEWLALAGLVNPGWVVADLGCGTGLLAASLAPLAARVVAVDESPAMLRAARQRVKHSPTVDVRSGTLEALPIETGTVNAAFIVLVLHHVAEPARAFREVARILAPGGRVVVVDMVPHERTDYRDGVGHQWLGFGPEQLRSWSDEAGLTSLAYRPLPPRPEVKGPSLFVATATDAGRSHA